MRTQESALRDVNAEIDRQLVQSIARASGDALSQLYDRYAATVFGLAKRILGRADVAEEVVQDVFAQVWREAPRYEAGRGAVGAWIVTVTRARAIDRLRAWRARPDQAMAVEPSLARPIAAGDRSPEAASISAEEAQLVRAALTKLPDNQRALIELAYYEGLTHSEIAARTGAPLGTVKTRLRTALTSLREVLPA